MLKIKPINPYKITECSAFPNIKYPANNAPPLHKNSKISKIKYTFCFFKIRMSPLIGEFINIRKSHGVKYCVYSPAILQLIPNKISNNPGEKKNSSVYGIIPMKKRDLYILPVRAKRFPFLLYVSDAFLKKTCCIEPVTIPIGPWTNLTPHE